MFSTYTLAKLLLVQLDQHGELATTGTETELIRVLATRLVELHETAELLCKNLAADLQQISDLQRVLDQDTSA